MEQPNGQPIVDIKGVHKYYGDLHVLKGVDLSVDAGEIVAIVGKSGAGKSTLLHVAGTLDKADEGTIEIDGHPTEGLKGKQLARFRNRSIGFIFQFHHLLDEFTALENVCMPSFIQGKDQEEARERAEKLLDYLGLAERLEHKPKQLSGGEQQRVAVARALINDPKVIFADEPSGNLDEENSRDLHEWFLRLRDEFNQTFIMVTHQMEWARMSNRIVELSGGRIKN